MLLTIYLISIPICFVLSYAMMFADVQRRCPTIAEEDYRSDLGMSMLFGLLLGPFSIAGLIMTYLSTGFAEHGLKFK